VAPVAAKTGLTIEETTAALSVLFDVGLRGEQAGTALRNIFTNLIDPGGEAIQVLRKLNIETRTSTGGLRNMIDILKDLSNIDLTEADLSRLGGREAVAGLTALLSSLRGGRFGDL
jgi:TP901 family phage tail tape measure protein